MPNFSVNWTNFVKNNLRYFKRKEIRLAWIDTIIYPVKQLHTKFLTFWDTTYNLASHTNQKISIEKILNDHFDNDDRGIYIGLISQIDKVFLHQKSEEQPIIIYNKWSDSIAYVAGNFAVYGSYVWIATDASTDEAPFDGSDYWEIHKPRFYLHNVGDYGSKGFIVYVPVAVTYDEYQMRALIERYKLAGMYYEIQTY